MSDVLKLIAEYTAYALEALAALIIAFGALRAIWTYLRHNIIISFLKVIFANPVNAGYSSDIPCLWHLSSWSAQIYSRLP